MSGLSLGRVHICLSTRVYKCAMFFWVCLFLGFGMKVLARGGGVYQPLTMDTGGRGWLSGGPLLDRGLTL